MRIGHAVRPFGGRPVWFWLSTRASAGFGVCRCVRRALARFGLTAESLSLSGMQAARVVLSAAAAAAAHPVLIQFVDSPYNLHRLPELDSVLTLLGLRPEDVYSPPPPPSSSSGAAAQAKPRPFLFARLTLDQARAVCARAVLVRRILFVWAHGPDLERLPATALPADHELVAPFCHAQGGDGGDDGRGSGGGRWKLTVDFFGPGPAADERARMRAAVLGFPVRPAGDPVAPGVNTAFEHHFMLIEDRQLLSSSSSGGGGGNSSPWQVSSQASSRFYFGWEVAVAQKGLLSRYDLKKRAFIGPTSTCAKLAFLMSNQTLAGPGACVAVGWWWCCRWCCSYGCG